MKASLSILITNNTLAQYAGSECYVLDLAKGLVEAGHKPAAFTLRKGLVAKKLRQYSVPVVTDLSKLTVKPDIIHGQHHLETMIALCHYPNTPAINMCHGWLPWEEQPVIHPRVLGYLAVDQLCRERLICEHGITSDKVKTIHNFLHLLNYPPRSSLPSKPQKALYLSNYATHNNSNVIKSTCEKLNIELDIIGSGMGNAINNPCKILAQYDLVFGKARCAMEAMAVGCATVVLSDYGIAGMVTQERLRAWQPLNFGLRTMMKPITSAVLCEEMNRFDPKDAEQVSFQMRQWLAADPCISSIVQFYRKMISQYEATPISSETKQESLAMANYLTFIKDLVQDNRKLSLQLKEARLNNQSQESNNQLSQNTNPIASPWQQWLMQKLNKGRTTS